MNCNCINETDDKLREKNLKIVGYSFIMPSFTPVVTIATKWVDKEKAPRAERAHPPGMLASYCPFCGKKIQLPKEKESE